MAQRERLSFVVEESPGPEPGEVTLKAEDGSQVTVKPEVAGLNGDPPIRKKAREVVEPLKRRAWTTSNLDVLTAELEQGSTRKWRFWRIGSDVLGSHRRHGVHGEVFPREQFSGVGDRLHAKVKIVQKRDPAISKIRFERQVMEVKEVIETSEQLSLKKRTEELQRGLGSGADDAENGDDRPVLPAEPGTDSLTVG